MLHTNAHTLVYNTSVKKYVEKLLHNDCISHVINYYYYYLYTGALASVYVFNDDDDDDDDYADTCV